MSEVTSVNGKTGAVVLKATDVEAIPTSEAGKANGVATLDSGGKLPEAQLPSPVANSSAATISPKTYGAKWDGMTDDSEALQKAIEASEAQGGTPVVLPAGTGVIKSSIKIRTNLGFVVPIRGAGMLDTIVKMPTSLQFLKFVNTSPGETVGNLDLSEFTIDGQSVQETENKSVPVVCGTDINSNNQVNIKNVHIRRVRTLNIPKLDKEEGGRRNINLTTNHPEPGLTQCVIENIDIRECVFEGGQYGVFIGGTAGKKVPINVKLAHIYIGDCQHLSTEVPTEKEGFECNFQIGQYGFSDGKSIVLERLYGENSGDVGIEMDVPCIINDCWIKDANNTAYLFNTFNCATLNAPIVTKTTETLEKGNVSIKVASHAGFTEGEPVVIFGANVNVSEVRTIKSFPDTEHIEFTEATGIKWESGTWIQQIDDMSAAGWKGRNLKAVRTTTFLGSNRGLSVQNSENVLPCPAVEIDGYEYVRTAADVPAIQGEIISCSAGTTNSPTGNPTALRIRGLRARIRNFTYTGTEGKSYWPIYLIMRGNACPIDIQGEVSVEGPGATSTGKVSAHIVHLGSTKGILDIDLITQWTLKNTGGEAWRGLVVNQESSLGDITGRIRHRTRASTIKEGGAAQTGVRLGKGCGFASQIATTTIKGGALPAKSTVIPVKSTEGFANGMAIVVDATSTTKGEIFVISSIAVGESITVVSVGNSPGTAVEHLEGAVVSALRTLAIENCDWFGFGASGVGLTAEDENVFMRVLTHGNIPAAPPTPQAIILPESTKAFQIIQKGAGGSLSVQGGTVTNVEWSPDGKNFYKLATATGVVFKVNTGDFVKLTWTVEPTVKFAADRV